jgi:hypothetical protein
MAAARRARDSATTRTANWSAHEARSAVAGEAIRAATDVHRRLSARSAGGRHSVRACKAVSARIGA